VDAKRGGLARHFSPDALSGTRPDAERSTRRVVRGGRLPSQVFLKRFQFPFGFLDYSARVLGRRSAFERYLAGLLPQFACVAAHPLSNRKSFVGTIPELYFRAWPRH